VFSAAGKAFSADATVLNFDDLTAPYLLTGTSYAGLTWEQGNPGDSGFLGEWVIPGPPTDYPHSAPNNIINSFGSSMMGIGFPSPVDMSGSYIATQGGSAGMPQRVRVHGYLAGQEVGTTGWFTQISTTPAWFDMTGLTNVNRIVFEAPPMGLALSYYGIDDLTFTPIPEPAGLAALGFVGAGLMTRRRRGA
jgi:hypothetical protein